jgi:hypothetical protein
MDESVGREARLEGGCEQEDTLLIGHELKLVANGGAG